MEKRKLEVVLKDITDKSSFPFFAEIFVNGTEGACLHLSHDGTFRVCQSEVEKREIVEKIKTG